MPFIVMLVKAYGFCQAFKRLYDFMGFEGDCVESHGNAQGFRVVC